MHVVSSCSSSGSDDSVVDGEGDEVEDRETVVERTVVNSLEGGNVDRVEVMLA